jgi:Matrixin
MRWSIITLVAVAAIAFVRPAYAYNLSGGKLPQPAGLGTPVTITYSYQNMFDGSLLMPNGQPLPNSLIRTSIESAFGLWASVAPLHFVEVPDDGLTYNQGSTQYGNIRFRHVFINGPDPPPPALPVAKAQAYFPGGGVFSGDVEYDHGDRWQLNGTTPMPDILGATIHELGHSLGLNHTNILPSNMYWIFTRYNGPGTGQLFPDDIAGIRAIYGAGLGSVTPLTTIPEPATSLLLALMLLFFSPRRAR